LVVVLPKKRLQKFGVVLDLKRLKQLESFYMKND
jgi:hypothetical protein